VPEQVPALRPGLIPALAAFAAAARRQNFAHAGEELHLTASAVSHHVRRLEGLLGVTLFHRHARGATLTAEGRVLADATGSALSDIEAVLASLRGGSGEQRVRITTLPSFASAWLVPRLPGFAALHPQVRLDVDTDRALARFDGNGPELGVRYGPGRWQGLEARHLMDDALFAVAAPALAARIARPADVAALPLIGDLAMEGWREWFRASDVRGARIVQRHTFSDTRDALCAAAAGLGAVLARGRLCGRLLADGALVRLPGPTLPARFAYYVVHAAGRAPAPAAAAFMHWLHEEARSDG